MQAPQLVTLNHSKLPSWEPPSLGPCGGSVDVVVGDEEAQVEGEVDEGPEHRLQRQQHEVPHVVGDVVDV